MSIDVSVNLCGQPSKPHGYVLPMESGERFITIYPHSSVSIILDGQNEKAAETARTLADTLYELADELDAMLATDRARAIEDCPHQIGSVCPACLSLRQDELVGEQKEAKQ